MKKDSKQLISLVLPVYNEEESLPLLFEELQKQLKILSQNYNFELLFIDDGSSDNTVKELDTLKTVLPHQTLVFSRNFGHQAALLAGISNSRGDAVITMDSDLQHPPAFLHSLLEAYEEGFEIVFTKRVDHSSISPAKKLTSIWFYRLMNSFSRTKIQESGSDFRLMSRSAVDALLSLPEKRIFLRGMVSWIGFKTKTLEFTADKRLKGMSKYSFLKMLRLALDGISSFSTMPLYLSALVGVFFSISTILYGTYVLYIRFVVGDAVEGWSSVILVLLGMGSILSFLLAIVGIYIAALFDEVKQRPVFIIRK